MSKRWRQHDKHITKAIQCDNQENVLWWLDDFAILFVYIFTKAYGISIRIIVSSNINPCSCCSGTSHLCHIIISFLFIIILSFAYMYGCMYCMWITVTDYSIFFWFRGCCCCCLFSYLRLPHRLLSVVVSHNYRWRKKLIFILPQSQSQPYTFAIFRFML